MIFIFKFNEIVVWISVNYIYEYTLKHKAKFNIFLVQHIKALIFSQSFYMLDINIRYNISF
ncbi:hypothetical protein C4157_01145 [Clostridioides difficile]|nr:hypothetical protein DDG61_02085 [Clostridioides difficile]EQG24261.1 hypothetical protein QIG_0316 [Clostridioides difficile DA00065]AWH79845.1 hypothetical protein DDG63_02085 [Clostridioides difficile]EGT3892970.1 hypothetical protein [Clostridioides difficile]EGT3921069.1 hypothetical protein [Clostridioides difficile]